MFWDWSGWSLECQIEASKIPGTASERWRRAVHRSVMGKTKWERDWGQETGEEAVGTG